MKLKLLSTMACALTAWGTTAQAIVLTGTNDATVLANSIVGSGVTITNATYSGASSTAAGTFTGGNASGLGFDSGIVLTTGTIGCVAGPNDQTNCTGSGVASTLSFDFTTNSGNVFFKYVFASEEYNEFVNSSFNDKFELKLDGTNIALLPNGDIVEIDSVNNGMNSSFYRDNTVLGLDLQYDGLTTVLNASATGLTAGTHNFEFFITDIGDSSFDSGVFVQAGTFSGVDPNPVPEPGSLALLGLGLAGFGYMRKKQAK